MVRWGVPRAAAAATDLQVFRLRMADLNRAAPEGHHPQPHPDNRRHQFTSPSFAAWSARTATATMRASVHWQPKSLWTARVGPRTDGTRGAALRMRGQ